MHAAAGLADYDLRGESDVEPPLVCQIADNPFRKQNLVCCSLHRIGQELDFVLLVDLAVEGKSSYLRMAIFDVTSGLGDEFHTLAAEVVHLCERLGLMVTFLLCSGIERICV